MTPKPSTPTDRIRRDKGKIRNCAPLLGEPAAGVVLLLVDDLLTLAEALREISEHAYEWEDYDIEHEASHALAKVGGSEK